MAFQGFQNLPNTCSAHRTLFRDSQVSSNTVWMRSPMILPFLPLDLIKLGKSQRKMLPNLPVRKQTHREEITRRSLRGQWGIETLPRVDKKSRVSFPAVKSIPGFGGFPLIQLSGPAEENRSQLLNMESVCGGGASCCPWSQVLCSSLFSLDTR